MVKCSEEESSRVRRWGVTGDGEGGTVLHRVVKGLSGEVVCEQRSEGHEGNEPC